MNESSYLVDNKGKSSFKYILFFVIFFAIGIGLGVFVTKHFLKDKDADNGSPNEVVSDITDITNSLDYKNTIDKLMQTINGNVEFYNTNGVTISTMENDFKLRLLYKYVTKSNPQFETENINSSQWGATTCEQGFLVNVLSNDDGSEYLSGYCTVNRVPFSLFNDAYNTLFRDNNLDLNQEIVVGDKKCVPGEDVYLCGNINNDIKGDLTSKFNVIKVTLDKENNIQIYEKGYLVDTRSNIVNPDDGYDNYYLHSYDSNLYYYELKSSENLTFIHTFKLDGNNEYYYVSSELEKK